MPIVHGPPRLITNLVFIEMLCSRPIAVWIAHPVARCYLSYRGFGYESGRNEDTARRSLYWHFPI